LYLKRKPEWSMERVEEGKRRHHGKRLNLEALTGEQLESAAMEAGAPLEELLPLDFKGVAIEQGEHGGKDKKRNSRVDPSREDAAGDRVPGQNAGSSATPSDPETLTYSRLRGAMAMVGPFALPHDNSTHDRSDSRLS
jgi:hypothetical protein